MSGPVVNFDLELFKDAAGFTDLGFFSSRDSGVLVHGNGLKRGFTKNMVLLELFPVVLVVELWGSSFRDLKVSFQGDNMGVVQVSNRVLASSPPVIRLLQHLALRCLQLNVFNHAIHLPGVENVIADELSRFQWDRF